MRYFTSCVFCFFFPFGIFSQISLSIPQIQGSNSASPYVNQLVKANGVVTAKFIGSGKINGFFMQDALGDGNPLTSDGIFVSTSMYNISVGEKIEVTATVSETGGRTQLGDITLLTHVNLNNALPFTSVEYDADAWNWEQYEGMLLEFNQTLFVTNNYNLQRYGQLTLNPIRRYSASNQCLPGTTEFSTLASENAKAQITLDDGITTSNYTPVIFADADGTRRTGERVTNLQTVVDCVSSKFVLYPVIEPLFTGNPRPNAPVELGNYNLKVCAFNLEIYLADSYGKGFGPDNVSDANIQHEKILAALLAIDADVFGLIEIQQGQAALIKLVNALNVATFSGRYAFVNDGGASGGTYTKVAYVYRADKVKPYMNLKNNDNPSPYNRKKAQAFELLSNGERFIFSLNHFKAKSGCSSASGADADQGDGQSCYNATRVLEASSTLNLLNTSKAYFNDEDVLLMGDLNAYAKEDPIQTLIQGGLTDMHRVFHADSTYSYMYNGEAGYLDHALASASMAKQITGVSVFHINSDEPAMFEYSSSGYQTNMYRSSDHDPVVVGLQLGLVNFEDKVIIRPTFVNDDFVISNANGGYIQIYSVGGVLLKQDKILSDEHRVELGKLHLTAGVYLVRVLGEGTVKRMMVIKK